MVELQKWAEEMINYRKYCKEVAQERFKNDIIIFVNRVSYYDNVYFEAKKRAFSLAIEIMKELREGSPWEIINALYSANVKTILDMTLVGDVMLEYSEYGTTFIEHVLNVEAYRAIADLMKKYEDKKELEFLKEHGY